MGMRSYTSICKIFKALCKIVKQWNHTRCYRILQYPKQNPIKSILILVKILWDQIQDFERLSSILSNLPMESYSTVERSYGIRINSGEVPAG